VKAPVPVDRPYGRGRTATFNHAVSCPETEQRPLDDDRRDARCSFDKRASAPAASARLLGTISGRHGRREPDFRNRRGSERRLIVDRDVRRPQSSRTAGDARLTLVAVAIVEEEHSGCCDLRSVWNRMQREFAADDAERPLIRRGLFRSRG
jgi:hypothetical protein